MIITVEIMIFLQKYVENVKQDTNIMTNILRVSASDEDADNNGAIKYSLTAPYDPSDINYFDIQPESGWIFLKKPLDVSSHLFTFLTFPKWYENSVYTEYIVNRMPRAKILILHWFWKKVNELLLTLNENQWGSSCPIWLTEKPPRTSITRDEKGQLF